MPNSKDGTTMPGKVTSIDKAARGVDSPQTTPALSTGVSGTVQLELQFEQKPNQPTIKIWKFGPKSTATEAQYERIDRAFDYAGKLISTLDFRNMGVHHPSARIKEMNDKLGFCIPKVDQRTVIDNQGFPHARVAFYQLIDRPASGGHT